MNKIIITEQERQDILNKYQDNTDDKVFTYLRRNYPVMELEPSFLDKKIKYIVVGEKMRYLQGNKDYLKTLIKNEIIDNFPDVSVPTLVRTIKKFLSLIFVD